MLVEDLRRRQIRPAERCLDGAALMKEFRAEIAKVAAGK